MFHPPKLTTGLLFTAGARLLFAASFPGIHASWYPCSRVDTCALALRAAYRRGTHRTQERLRRGSYAGAYEPGNSPFSWYPCSRVDTRALALRAAYRRGTHRTQERLRRGSYAGAYEPWNSPFPDPSSAREGGQGVRPRGRKRVPSSCQKQDEPHQPGWIFASIIRPVGRLDRSDAPITVSMRSLPL